MLSFFTTTFIIQPINSPVYTITEEELLWLLHGLKIEDIRHYKKVVSEQ